MADETKNVKISFEKRVEAQLEVLQSLVIDYEGTVKDPAGVADGAPKNTEFVEVRSLGYTAAPARKGRRTERWGFQFTVNVLVGFEADGVTPINTTHRKWEIVDLIEAAFGQHDLDVLNFSTLASLFFLRFEEGQVVQLSSGGALEGDDELPRWDRSVVSYEAQLIT